MKVIAHRGLSWSYPENTLPAFRAAIEVRPDMVELDYHTTRDGVLVCVHDGKLDRYLAGSSSELCGRQYSEFTLRELQGVDFGRWKHERFGGTRIATLAEVLELFADAGGPTLLVEHKQGTAQELLKVMDGMRKLPPLVVQSFSWEFLRDVRQRRPELSIAVLGGKEVTDCRIDEARAMGAVAVHWADADLSADAVKRVHAAGMEAWVYTPNTAEAWASALERLIDGVTTDRCDLACEQPWR